MCLNSYRTEWSRTGATNERKYAASRHSTDRTLYLYPICEHQALHVARAFCNLFLLSPPSNAWVSTCMSYLHWKSSNFWSAIPSAKERKKGKRKFVNAKHRFLLLVFKKSPNRKFSLSTRFAYAIGAALSWKRWKHEIPPKLNMYETAEYRIEIDIQFIIIFRLFAM